MPVHVKQSPETASVQLGASMTLQCSLLYTNKESRAQCPGEHSVHWFRAGSGGFHPGIIYTHSNRSDEQEERSCVYSLSKTIQNSSDAGTYYCAVVTCGEILFGEGTKVETKSRAQCPGEHSLHWFRAGSGGFHPSIIYTHSNRSDEQEERSCVYSLSKTIQNSSDAGTYYCAVVTCGEILFGEGTKVETIPELDPVNIVLGGLLACCLTVIAVLIFFMSRGKVCEHCQGSMRASHVPGHNKLAVHQSTDPDGDADATNYVALAFSKRRGKREKKKIESPEECVYSAVKTEYHTSH
ncbi:uncharacterized protein LOC111648289 [Seriola lalandi dorsalis]|uniref:uncharacterized protein LOC111648289 n=1 Tax=Seriola lalandi dorsalis TaxID=1841481 RepID=UPI000C6FC657|nr:uncharacterized protein LOC111648289 [Seriola lalandi dorsalis]